MIWVRWTGIEKKENYFSIILKRRMGKDSRKVIFKTKEGGRDGKRFSKSNLSMSLPSLEFSKWLASVGVAPGEKILQIKLPYFRIEDCTFFFSSLSLFNPSLSIIYLVFIIFPLFFILSVAAIFICKIFRNFT